MRETTKPGHDNYVRGDYWMICDVSGMKMRRSEARKTWDGLWVHHWHYDPKHPQISIKPTKEKQRVPVARPDSPPVFVGQITKDDL